MSTAPDVQPALATDAEIAMLRHGLADAEGFWSIQPDFMARVLARLDAAERERDEANRGRELLNNMLDRQANALNASEIHAAAQQRRADQKHEWAITEAQKAVAAERQEKTLRGVLTDLCDAWDADVYPDGHVGGGKFKGNVTNAHKAARAALEAKSHD